jgi:hypothetical protein
VRSKNHERPCYVVFRSLVVLSHSYSEPVSVAVSSVNFRLPGQLVIIILPLQKGVMGVSTPFLRQQVAEVRLEGSVAG